MATPTEDDYKRKVEEILLYPQLAELHTIFRLLEQLAGKKWWHEKQVELIEAEVSKFFSACRGQVLDLANLSEFRRGDALDLDRMRSTLETSTLRLAAAVIYEDAEEPRSVEELVLDDFWLAAERLSTEELLSLVQAAKEPPRKALDLEQLHEDLQTIVGRYGVAADEGGSRAEEG